MTVPFEPVPHITYDWFTGKPNYMAVPAPRSAPDEKHPGNDIITDVLAVLVVVLSIAVWVIWRWVK
jgi:hypothetical protein